MLVFLAAERMRLMESTSLSLIEGNGKTVNDQAPLSKQLADLYRLQTNFFQGRLSGAIAGTCAGS